MKNEHEATPRKPVVRKGFVVCLLGAAFLITAFYQVENWRGDTAWSEYRQTLVSQGEQLDWMNHKPRPVPEDQNFFKAPHIEEWFVKQDTRKRTALNLRKKMPPATNTLVIELATRITEGAGVAASELCGPGYDTLARKLSRLAGLPPAYDPGSDNLIVRLPNSTLRMNVRLDKADDVDRLRQAVTKAGMQWEAGAVAGVYRVTLKKVRTPEEILAECSGREAFWNALEKACARPRALLGGDWNRPVNLPSPDYVHVRETVQVLGARAQASLMTSRSDAALNDLTMMHRLNQHLRESGDSLVSAMVHVAISQIYANTVALGLSQSWWTDRHLETIEAQIKEYDLLGTLTRSLRIGERAALLHVLDRMRSHGVDDAFPDKPDVSLDPSLLALHYGPGGWIAQNQLRLARWHQAALAGFDQSGRSINPPIIDAGWQRVEHELGGFRCYQAFAEISIPNTRRAVARTASSQNLLNEARIGAALLRYQRQAGSYPEQLFALVPNYLDSLPDDVVGGKPMKFRRLSESGYVLYSVGWDSQDDGGTIPAPEDGTGKGDWIWPHSPRGT